MQLNLSEEDLRPQEAWYGLSVAPTPSAAGLGGNTGVIAGLYPRRGGGVTVEERLFRYVQNTYNGRQQPAPEGSRSSEEGVCCCGAWS